MNRPIVWPVNNPRGRGLEWRHDGNFRKPCTGLRGEAPASLCIIIPVRAARCALQLLGQARVCAFLSSSSVGRHRHRRLLLLLLLFLLLPSFASRLVVVTVFSRRQPPLAEPRCSSVSNNHGIRACGKSTCWLPLNESERARARTPLCHRRDVQLNHAVRASVLPHQDHSSGRERLPGDPRRRSRNKFPQRRSSDIQSVAPKTSRGFRRIPRISARCRDIPDRGGAQSRRD